MGTKYRNLWEDVFIWRGNKQTYYLKRDKEIMQNIMNNYGNAFGFVGSDVINETLRDQKLVVSDICPVKNQSGDLLRFALAVCDTQDSLDKYEAKVAAGEPVAVATSYPATAKRELFSLGLPAEVVPVGRQSGGIEALPWQYPDKVDAVFELVQSGDSMVENGLRVVEDDIKQVMLQKAEPWVGSLRARGLMQYTRW